MVPARLVARRVGCHVQHGLGVDMLDVLAVTVLVVYFTTATCIIAGFILSFIIKEGGNDG